MIMNDMKGRWGKTAAMAALIAAASPSALLAQEQLSKEITIERDIVPEVRAAKRLNVFPAAITQTPRTVTLQAHDITETTDIPAMIATLDAAPTSAAAPRTPYRGYVDAGGFFPGNIADISAGYAIISDQATRLNVWGQFNTDSYRRDSRHCFFAPSPITGEVTAEDGYKHRATMTSGRLGVDFGHIFDGYGTLSASTSFGFASFTDTRYKYTVPDTEWTDKTKQGTLDWNLDLLWKGNTASGLRYFIGAGTGLFNFTKNLPPEEIDGSAHYFDLSPRKAVHETSWNLSAGISQDINDVSRAGVELSAEFDSFNHWRDGNLIVTSSVLDDQTTGNTPYWDDIMYGASAKGKTLGVITFKPYYRLQSGCVTLKAGVNLEGSVNSGRFLHISPDVTLAVNPASGFGAWLKAEGGEHINSARSLWTYSRYANPLYTYRTSSVPLKGEFGLRFGPVKGLWLALDLGYACADNWLLPVWNALGMQSVTFREADLRAWKFGGTLHYDYGTIVSAEVAFHTTAGNGVKGSWLEWRDRERSRLDAAVSVRPIERLTLDLGYRMSLKRNMLMGSDDGFRDISLGDKSNLSVGAAYRITGACSVFARVENLLNDKNWVTPDIPGIGVTGLVGVALKF